MVMLANQPPLLVYIWNPVSSFWLLVSSEPPPVFARVARNQQPATGNSLQIAIPVHPISWEVGDELNT
jgi:hypothetical protein